MTDTTPRAPGIRITIGKDGTATRTNLAEIRRRREEAQEEGRGKEAPSRPPEYDLSRGAAAKETEAKRRANVLGQQPSGPGRRLRVREMDNPFIHAQHKKDADDGKEQVIVNTAECSYLQMYHRKQIDYAQYRAAEKFRSAYERAGAAGARAIDYEALRVDTSIKGNPAMSDAVCKALTDLTGAARMLGESGFRLMERFAGDGWGVKQVAKQYAVRADGTVPKKTYDFVSGRIQEGLNDLARLWNFS